MSRLTHFDDSGASRMVDVGGKEITDRQAKAEAFVTLAPDTLRLILNKELAKGDVIEVARLAGIMGSKRTSDLIPLCHPLGLDAVEVDIQPVDDTTLRIVATTRVQGRTGVEMEALTAVSAAALTIYDMCKSVERGISIGPIRLVEKSGGRSGHWVRGTGDPATH
jgi:cyclic pyranopterin phosphate synthase